MNVVVCRRCGADIIWCVTDKGRKMPMDAHPEFRGTFSIEPRERGLDPLVHHLGHEAPMPRYVSHFATCSNPPERKRSKRTKAAE